MRVAAENLVRTFSRENDFIARIPHRTAQQVFRNTVRIEAEIFRTSGGVGEVIRQIILADWNWEELSARFYCHLSGNLALVVLSPIKAESESSNRSSMMPCRQPKHSARVQSSAEVASHRYVGPQTNPHRLFQGITKLRGILGIRPQRCGAISRGIVEVPILTQLDVLVGRDQVVSGRDLKHSVKERTCRMAAVFDTVIDRLRVPTRRHTCGKQRLGFRGQV